MSTSAFKNAVNLLANTQITTTLNVCYQLDKTYPSGIKVSDPRMEELRDHHSRASEYHRDRNYTIYPKGVPSVDEVSREPVDPACGEQCPGSLPDSA